MSSLPLTSCRPNNLPLHLFEILFNQVFPVVRQEDIEEGFVADDVRQRCLAVLARGMRLDRLKDLDRSIDIL